MSASEQAKVANWLTAGRRLNNERQKAELNGPYLTPEQLAILKLSVVGLSTKRIAARTGLARTTIDYHKQCIMARCNASDWDEAMSFYCLIRIRPEFLETLDLRKVKRGPGHDDDNLAKDIHNR